MPRLRVKSGGAREAEVPTELIFHDPTPDAGSAELEIVDDLPEFAVFPETIGATRGTMLRSGAVDGRVYRKRPLRPSGNLSADTLQPRARPDVDFIALVVPVSRTVN